jgi:hypothetical protein
VLARNPGVDDIPVARFSSFVAGFTRRGVGSAMDAGKRMATTKNR